MRVLLTVKPQFFIPPEYIGQLIQGFIAWREQYKGYMETFDFFAGGTGGCGVLNVPDEATLQQMTVDFPLTPFCEITAQPLLAGDVGLQQWAAAAQRMASAAA